MSELQCCLSASISDPFWVSNGWSQSCKGNWGVFCMLGNFPCGQSLSLESLVQLLLLCSLFVIVQGSHGLSRYTETQACFPSVDTVMSPWL